MIRDYPETRNSHMAAEIERCRAIRRLSKLTKSKGTTMAISSDSGSIARNPTPLAAVPSAPPAPPPRKIGTPLARADRDVIIAEVTANGRERVTSDLCRMFPEKTRLSHYSTIACLVKDGAHRWGSTNLRILQRLAASYRADPTPAQRPAPALPLVPARNALVLQQPTAVQSAQKLPSLETVQTFATAIATAVTTALAPLLQGQIQQSERLLPAVSETADDYREPGIKQFRDLGIAMQRRILNTMHDRYAATMRREMGVLTGEHSAAWNMSYEAYDRETGAGVRDKASAESDSTGTRTRPLDIIERDGDLVRFWEIVRRTWERA